MQTYDIEKIFPRTIKLTEKVIAVMKMFGLDRRRLSNGGLIHKCNLKIKPGDICYITGPSGSGKSVLLNELYEMVNPDERLNLKDIPLEKGKTLIDCIEGDFFSGLRLLSKAGLSDVFSVLNEPVFLSEGQKYRYRLARAIASGRKIIFADEFCSGLDRITAAVIAHNIRKIAAPSGLTFVLASSHDDMLCDLLADVVVIKHLSGKTEVIYKDRR